MLNFKAWGATMKPFNRWFKSEESTTPRRSERRPAPGLFAYHSTDLAATDPTTIAPSSKPDEIANISSTGVYLLTDERWPPGTIISLTLQRKGPPESSSERRITLPAKAVRWGKDGVGLSFALPTEMDRHLWESLLESSPETVEPDDIVREFRLAEAIAFLTRICPAAEEKVKSLLFGGVSNIRALSAVEIALKAEEMLAALSDATPPDATPFDATSFHATRSRIVPRLLLRILEDGSWATDESIQHMWSGLLATACSRDETTESEEPFADVFSQLAATHVHVLAAACSRAVKTVSEDGGVCALPLVCTREDMIKTTGWHDLVRIERDLEHMTDLGLFEKSVKSASFLSLNEANITPTPFALKLYARCNGHRGAARNFYGVGNNADSCRQRALKHTRPASLPAMQPLFIAADADRRVE